jgi:hypothetical protein
MEDFAMHEIALVIIYNHQYNENVPVLEEIYKKRFSSIFHLVPFYAGNRANVIPVYENSRYFQGYIAQGFNRFYDKNFTHYFFIADDLLLNTLVNQNNCYEYLHLDDGACFLPEFISLHERETWWARVGDAFRFNLNTPGVEARKQLPDYQAALHKFSEFGLDIKPLKFNQIWKKPASIRDCLLNYEFYIARKLRCALTNEKFHLSYPLLGGYSDIFVISSNAIKQFCHYCGIFAAMNLFVEVAIPTAMVLSAQSIVTEKDLKMQGKALWTKEELATLDKYNYELKNFLMIFRQIICIYIR